jgi:hypothetical protein
VASGHGIIQLLVIALSQLTLVKYSVCGLDHDPRTGEVLPVCEGLGDPPWVK